eukprot:Protomagalhaensia_sp_Gyna_25__1452@NODE_1736_length_1575_cov_153_899740_g1425_i0_p1_GENE_NODE_1736_length_1575_cov_153_899740_g1425_i0NODE_1736_length_1575_cov_153_899740_g1425_i0_p1_ORF_typecomplete_len481_score64_66Branch/PF02485_21/2_3e06Mob_Pre/PF01076_19/1_2Mob_Pre/PF01076_19/1_6e03_NODE_1736_length_1575_cov_153_899740_g1425_i0561498
MGGKSGFVPVCDGVSPLSVDRLEEGRPVLSKSRSRSWVLKYCLIVILISAVSLGYLSYIFAERQTMNSFDEAAWALVSMREQLLKSSIPMPYNGSEPFGVALLFETYVGMELSEIWHRWFEDAHQWIEKRLGYVHSDEGSNPILQAFVHYSYKVNRTFVEQGVPPLLRPGVVNEPAICSWQSTTECAAKLYLEAYSRMPSAQMFILISHNTIPLKPFRAVYESLHQDTRNRISFLALYHNYHDSNPKYSNWKIWNRKTVEDLLMHQDMWSHQRVLGGGPDELTEVAALLKLKGESFLSQVNCALWIAHPDGYDTTTRMREHGSEFCHQLGFTFECWDHCGVYCNGPSDFEPGAGSPVVWKSIKASALDELIATPHIHWGRKFTAGTMVAGCTIQEEAEGAGQDKPPPKKEEEGVGGGDLCSLTDYLINKLGLVSAKNKFEPPPRLNTTDKRGDTLQGMLDSCHPAILSPFALQRCKTNIL